MSKARTIVSEFYMPDVLLDVEAVSTFLHEDVLLEWNSTKGFVAMHKHDILELSKDLKKAYIKSIIRISHFVAEENKVALRYSHFVKTIENPNEEMLLANFCVFWELKDGKLYRGYQMSQFS
ncbi:nuclear transport factor 2 family protein [Flavobacterium croceum]|uniref:SnoaL-like protein n=1 Tax=Flavobacterium croceum DSM 17960 TaxID=1121886 RepID=A0A2S4N8L1_9FLAO|nr:nuclear transport factor 2 family protein [Flavobacterium croceum]POS02030.1 hypothetical protein Q361_10692 [Flavobacterium croceum DSM 17960]